MGSACYGMLGATPPDEIRAARRFLLHHRREVMRDIGKQDTVHRQTIKAVRDANKRNDTMSVRVLAEELVRSNRAKERLQLMLLRLDQCLTRLRQVKTMRNQAEALSAATAALNQIGAMLSIDETMEIKREYQRNMARYNVRQELIDAAMTEVAVEGGDGNGNDNDVNAVLVEVLGTGKVKPLVAVDAPIQDTEVDQILSDILPKVPRAAPTVDVPLRTMKPSDAPHMWT